MKLTSEFQELSAGDNFYILDEPIAGLHTDDIKRLLVVSQRLVGQGNIVLVIERNLGVIRTADWSIDLGPEGGEDGGQIVTTGTPEEVVGCEKSWARKYLKPVLQRGKNRTLENER